MKGWVQICGLSLNCTHFLAASFLEFLRFYAQTQKLVNPMHA